MPRRNFIVAARHDVGIQADAYRVRSPEAVTELLQYRNIIEVDVHAEVLCLDHFIEINAIGLTKYPVA